MNITRSSRASRAERTPGPKATIRANAGEPHKAERRMTWRKAFHEIIWPRRKNVLIGLVLIVISRGAGLVLPGSTKYLMDDVVAKQDLGMLKVLLMWDPLESTCRHASLSIL